MLYWLTQPIAIAAIISFIVGSFGFVIGRLVLYPLMQYAWLKHRIRRTLSTATLDNGNRPHRDDVSRMIRQHADALSACSRNTLPRWYLLALKNRGESPDEAVRHMMALANITDPRHAESRIDRIRAALHMT